MKRRILIEEGDLIFPIVFIYPEFGQFDYVEKTEGDTSLIESFSEIFEAGLPWDEKGFYKEASNLVFALKVGKIDSVKQQYIDHEKARKLEQEG